MSPDALIVGAGPAGLAAGACLREAGLAPVLVDAAGRIGDSWRKHYDRLHLHTTRRLSGLPGLPIPRRFGRWVARDDVVRYLERYATHHGLEVRLGVETRRVDRRDGGWVVRTTAGDLATPRVVVATGYNRLPHLPDWPGRDGYTGDLIHASDYRTPRPYRGRDVLVVGTGNSGAEIAADLAEQGAARVRIAVRTPPTIFPRDALGVPSQAIGIALAQLPPRVVDVLVRPLQRVMVGDLSRHGMPTSKHAYSQFLRDDVVPILDVGLVDQLKAGRVEVVPAVEGFDGPEILLAGGERIRADAVIAATGYRRGLEPLVGHLGVLRPNGRPVPHGPDTHPAAPGLHFLGYTNPLGGNLRQLGIDARRIARAIARG